MLLFFFCRIETVYFSSNILKNNRIMFATCMFETHLIQSAITHLHISLIICFFCSFLPRIMRSKRFSRISKELIWNNRISYADSMNQMSAHIHHQYISKSKQKKKINFPKRVFVLFMCIGAKNFHIEYIQG